MITCPNKNLQEWKDLVEVFGEEGSLALYATNSENIPTIKDAFDLLYKGKVNITDSLRAWNTGDISGKDQKQYEPEMNKLMLKDPNAKIGGGESFNEVRDRAIAEGKRILETAPANSAVVTHSTVLKFIDLWNKAGRPDDLSDITADKYLKQSTTTGEMEKVKGSNGDIFFIRHGETEDNADGMLRTDSTLLTEKGVQQANKVGEQLKTIGISEVYTSPLPRALHSTDLIMSKQTLKVLDPNKLFEKGTLLTKSSKYIADDETFEDSIVYDLEVPVFDFLKGLGVQIEELDDLKERTGYSITSASDLLTRTILLQKNAPTSAFTKEAAYMIFELLGRKNILRKDIIASINLLEDYDKRLAKYKTSELSDYKKRELVAIDYLQERMNENFKNGSYEYQDRIEEDKFDKEYKSKDASAKNKLEYAILKIKKWWNDLLRKFFKEYKRKNVKQKVNQLANDILNRNYRKFSTQKQTENLLDGDAVLAKDPELKKTFDTLKEIGLVPSGSYALSKQGTMYRDSFKDLDFYVPYELSQSGEYLKTLKQKFDKVEVQLPYKGAVPNTYTMTIKLNGKHTVDLFFTNSKDTNNIQITKDGVHDWYSVFEAKLRIGGKKHIADLINFVPKESSWDFRSGLRHFNFDFIKSNFNYNYEDSETRIYDQDVDVKSLNLNVQYTQSIIKDAKNYLTQNGIYKNGDVLAPNGNPSKQFDTILKFHKDNFDNAIVDYWKTYSENFKAWYGIIESRADYPKFSFGKLQGNYSKKSIFIDENGEPLIQYHGAGTIFDKFSKDRFLSGEGMMAYGAGFYGTNNEPTADGYRDTSKAAIAKIKELIDSKNEEFLKLLGEYNKTIEDLDIKFITNLISSVMNAREDSFAGKLLSQLGLSETKYLYVQLSNPLDWFENISEGQRKAVESNFNLTLPRKIKGGELYHLLEEKLNVSDVKLSEMFYNIGIDGTIHPTKGGRAAGGFMHQKGEIHFVIFEPIQAKAVNNTGLFTKENANMYDPVAPVNGIKANRSFMSPGLEKGRVATTSNKTTGITPVSESQVTPLYEATTGLTPVTKATVPTTSKFDEARDTAGGQKYSDIKLKEWNTEDFSDIKDFTEKVKAIIEKKNALQSMGAQVRILGENGFQWYMENLPSTGLTQGKLFPTSGGRNFQRGSTGGPRIPGLEKRVKGFLGKLGIEPKNIDRVLDSFGNDVAALVDTANGIIEVSNELAGAESLGHEATHMMLDLLPDNSPLLSEIINDVMNRPEYQDTVDTYSNDPEYQNEDGSINEEKMAKEAASHIIDDIIVNKYKDKKAMSWWQKLLSWVKKIFKKADKLDPYEQVAEDILAEDISGLDKDKIAKMKQANQKGEIYYEHDKTDLDRINDIRNKKTTTVIQKAIIDAFVLKPEKFEPEIEKTVKDLGLKPNELVIFYEKQHEYKNTKGDPYSGLTNKITGKFDKSKQEQYEKNRDVGKDIDSILKSVILGKTTEEIINTVDTPTLPNEIKYRIIARQQELIEQVTSNGEIALAQVIISDPNTMIASAIDLLTVSKTGMWKIFDLKTSVNKVYSYDPVSGKKILSSTYTSLWKQNDGSVFNDLTFDKDNKIVPRTGDQQPILLSKRLQNGIQVGCYGKMGELQGAPVVGLYSKHDYVTIEAKKDINGNTIYKKDENGKNELDSAGNPKPEYIVTKYEDEGIVYHPIEKNLPYIDKIITTPLDENNPSELQKDRTGYYYPNADANKDMRSAEEIAKDKEAYDDEFNEALDNSEVASRIAEKINETTAQRIKYMEALNKGKQTPVIKPDTIIQLRQLKQGFMRYLNAGKYSSVINDWMDYTIRQSNTTRNYLQDPENLSSAYYPSIIVQAQKFVEGYAFINEMVNQVHSTQIKKFNEAVAAVNDLRKACEQGVRNWAEYDTKQQGTKYMESEIHDAIHGETEDIGIGYRLVGAPSATPSVLVSMAFKKISDAEYKARAWWTSFTNDLDDIEVDFFKSLGIKGYKRGVYDFMTHPENGTFVLREGSQHLERVRAAAEALQDESGQRKKFLLGKSKEVIEYNKQLDKQLQEYSRLTRAEYYSEVAKGYIDGEYYEYAPVPIYDQDGNKIGEDDFEKQRMIFEKKTINGRWVEDFNTESLKGINWVRDKADNKYYVENPDGTKGELLSEEQLKALKGLQYKYKFKMPIDNIADKTGQYDKENNFTGIINGFEQEPIWTVRPEYKKLRDKQLKYDPIAKDYVDGEDLRDEKYVKMISDNTPIGEARFNFYNSYMDALNKVIIKLPEEQRAYLKGTMPMQSSELFTQIVDGNLPITKMQLLKDAIAKKFSTGTYHGERLVDENGNIKHSIPTGYSGSKVDQDAIDKVNEKIKNLNANWDAVKDTATKEERFVYKKQYNLLVDERTTLERKIKPYQIEQNIVRSLHDLSYKVAVFDQKSKIEDAFLAIRDVAKIKSEKSQLLKTDADGRPLFKKVLGGITDAMKRLTHPGSNEYKRIVDMENMLMYQSNEYGSSFWARLEQLPITLTSLNLFLLNPPVSFGVSISMKATHLREGFIGQFFNLKQFARSEFIMNKEMIPGYIANQSAKSVGGKTKKYGSYGEAWIAATQANTKLMIEDVGVAKQLLLLEHFVEYSGIAIGSMCIGMNTPLKGADGEFSNAYDCWIEQPDGTLKIDPNYEESYNKIAISLNRKMADYQNRFHGAYAKLEAAAITQYPGGRSIMFLHKYVWSALTGALGPRMVHSNLGVQEGKYITMFNFIKDLKEFEGSIWKKMETGFRELLPLGATDNPDTWDKMNQDERQKADDEAYKKREQFHKKDKNGKSMKDENGEPIMDEEKVERDRDTRKMELGNMKRNLVDVVYLIVLYSSYLMLKSLAEDSDPGAAKKWANFLAKTFDRLRKQTMFAMPVIGLEEQYTLLKSPIASLRTMGEFAEVFSSTMGLVIPPYENNYYSNGVHKGELKAKVKWEKILPGINLVPWFKEQNNPNFWVK